jgi:cysteine synthase A
MTADEVAISHSTANFRFDKPSAARPAVLEKVEASDDARAFVREAIENASEPVVLFAFQWCEFCWAVRKLFARCGIAYRAIDIDAVAYQHDNWGGKIRAALTERSGLTTIPQLFIGGALIGGASETFAAFEHGQLQARLRESGVTFEDTVGDQVYSLLPGWVQRR